MTNVSSGDSTFHARWSGDKGLQLSDEVTRRLIHGEPLDDLQLGRVGGRIDLRGIRLSGPGRFGGVIADFQHVRLESLDLTASSLDEARFSHCQLDNCLFVGASCLSWRMWATDVRACSFHRADLRSAAFGGWLDGRGNVFTSVDFTSTRLNSLATDAAEYIDCDFSDASLDETNFMQSSLVRCKFAGPLRNVIFDGRHLGMEKADPNPMLDIDMTGAIIDRCSFRGIHFARVKLPSDPDLLVIEDRAVLQRAIAMVTPRSDDQGRALKAVLEGMLRYSSQGGGVLVNFRDLKVSGDLAREVLRRAIVSR